MKGKYIELRGGTDFLGDGPASAWFYRHTLDLTPGEAKLFKSLRDSTRRNIKKAGKEGVEVRVESTRGALREFYRLNCFTRREHGLPPQPWQFFEHLHEGLLARGMGTVALAIYRGNAIAANIYLHANGEVIYKYGASDKAHQNLRANNVVMWEAVKLYADRGFKSLCFGRTEPENEGLRQFKTGWGADESIINYYRYDLAAAAFVNGPKGVSARANQVFSRLPVAALKAIGGMQVRFAMPDGKSEDSDVANESAQYTPAGTHNPTNVGTARVDALLVEFKAAAPGKAALPASREGKTLKVLLTRKSIRVIDRPDSVGDPPSPCRRTG